MGEVATIAGIFALTFLGVALLMLIGTSLFFHRLERKEEEALARKRRK